MKTHFLLLPLFLGLPLFAQNDAYLPSDHASVDGSTFDRRLPFSTGATQHTQIIYDGVDLLIPNGSSITHLGFRRDAGVISLGTTLDLQIFMGTTTVDSATATNNFANNQTSPPVEVFTRKTYLLPDLGNPLNPNPNGDLVIIPLDMPFSYSANENLIVDYMVHGNGLGTAFNYQIDKATFLATSNQFGQGCTGSNNLVPTLNGPASNGGAPGTWTLNFARGLPNAIAVLAVSFQSTPPNPILQAFGAAGCDVFIDLNLIPITNLTNAGGAFNHTTQIPDSPGLNDLNLFAQVVVLDTAANSAGLVVSNAYHTEVGMTPRMTTIATPSLTSAIGGVVRNNGIVSLFRY